MGIPLTPACSPCTLPTPPPLQECVSEFIGFITSESSDRLVEDKRRTITGDDGPYEPLFSPLLPVSSRPFPTHSPPPIIPPRAVIDAMRALGFEKYIQPLEQFLQEYRKVRARGMQRASLAFERHPC